MQNKNFTYFVEGTIFAVHAPEETVVANITYYHVLDAADFFVGRFHFHIVIFAIFQVVAVELQIVELLFTDCKEESVTICFTFSGPRYSRETWC